MITYWFFLPDKNAFYAFLSDFYLYPKFLTVVKYNINFTILSILSVQFSGIKYIKNVM
jgi:hypothetical protein